METGFKLLSAPVAIWFDPLRAAGAWIAIGRGFGVTSLAIHALIPFGVGKPVGGSAGPINDESAASVGLARGSSGPISGTGSSGPWVDSASMAFWYDVLGVAVSVVVP